MRGVGTRWLHLNKVVGAIITGGQDNVQGSVGQIPGFCAELGCHFAQFPYVARSRGWTAEDMERNVAHAQSSEELRVACEELVDRSAQLAQRLLVTSPAPVPRRRQSALAHGRPALSRFALPRALERRALSSDHARITP